MEDKPTQNLKVFYLVSGYLSRTETKVLIFMIFNQGVSVLVFLDNNLELQPVAKCRENPTRNRPFLLQIAASHSVMCDTHLPPPLTKVVDPSFEHGLVLLATLIRRGKGITSTRS